MKSKYSLLFASYFENGPEWLWFVGLLVPFVLLTGLESNASRRGLERNATDRQVVCEMEAENRVEENRVKSELAAKSLLNAAADSVMTAIKPKRGASDALDLEGVLERAAPAADGDSTLRVVSFNGDLEYHAFLPALNRQEANLPLMRCRRLLLKSTGKPFQASALQLHVDLEVALPKHSGNAGDLAGNTVEK